jgi:hypothetical protein
VGYCFVVSTGLNNISEAALVHTPRAAKTKSSPARGSAFFQRNPNTRSAFCETKKNSLKTDYFRLSTKAFRNIQSDVSITWALI